MKSVLTLSNRARLPTDLLAYLSRYTAATCDPDDFTPAVSTMQLSERASKLTQEQQNGWELRQKQYGRDTELLVSRASPDPCYIRV